MGRKRSSAKFSDDGRTVSVWLRVDRRAYEFARHEAMNEGFGEPPENCLEGHLLMAMWRIMRRWEAPPEIEALYPAPEPTPDADDDDIPF